MVKILTLQRHPISSLLEIHFDNGFNEFISYELLRIYAVHTDGFSLNAPLITNKAFVKVNQVIKESHGVILYFNDGYRSCLFSNESLYQLCLVQDKLWLNYLNRLRIAQQAKSNQINCLQLS